MLKIDVGRLRRLKEIRERELGATRRFAERRQELVERDTTARRQMENARRVVLEKIGPARLDRLEANLDTPAGSDVPEEARKQLAEARDALAAVQETRRQLDGAAQEASERFGAAGRLFEACCRHAEAMGINVKELVP